MAVSTRKIDHFKRLESIQKELSERVLDSVSTIFPFKWKTEGLIGEIEGKMWINDETDTIAVEVLEAPIIGIAAGMLMKLDFSSSTVTWTGNVPSLSTQQYAAAQRVQNMISSPTGVVITDSKMTSLMANSSFPDDFEWGIWVGDSTSPIPHYSLLTMKMELGNDTSLKNSACYVLPEEIDFARSRGLEIVHRPRKFTKAETTVNSYPFTFKSYDGLGNEVNLLMKFALRSKTKQTLELNVKSTDMTLPIIPGETPEKIYAMDVSTFASQDVMMPLMYIPNPIEIDLGPILKDANGNTIPGSSATLMIPRSTYLKTSSMNPVWHLKIPALPANQDATPIKAFEFTCSFPIEQTLDKISLNIN